MNEPDFLAFSALFKEACLKCFGYPLKEPLTETESKLFYNEIFEHTGLTVGWKSIKNYSVFISNDRSGLWPRDEEQSSPGKRENPSVATLDTLSRYVLNAPYTTEAERKRSEGHYPYWFRYREQVVRSSAGEEQAPRVGAVTGAATGMDGGGVVKHKQKLIWTGAVFFVLALTIIIFTLLFRGKGASSFTDDFRVLQEDSLAARGWIVKGKDSSYWNKRGSRSGFLTLFTLKGDNWPDPTQTPVIRNLLLRKIPCDCFTLEVHLKDFIPRQNWQQAGILLSEDTGYTGKSIRISIAYNDYTGGYPRSRQILIQAITSAGGSGKPEEIAHIPLFNVDSLDSNPAFARNLDNSALRIERRGEKFRFLYSNGITGNSSFKEMVTHEFPMRVRYAGLFALKGFVGQTEEIPAYFKFFSLNCEACGAP
ncbi:MAG TPA: hypothetical protein VK563_23550 [Puia sp.]|nr:hypothetical protein [Puia sp.]